ncbi:MAG: glycosyltransferase 87 family protein [Anaerolineaceae bacterium]|nr:glycosyltransferase 87 family protein [Anaerolineaceae bacterium]
MPVLFLFGRIILAICLIPNDLYGFGDLKVHYGTAGLNGWPYINYWHEYPPVFPFLNAAIYRLASGNEVVYDFMMVFLVSLAGSVCLYLFYIISKRLHGENQAFLRTLIFFAILTPLPYTWWYFDLLPISLMLLGLYWMLVDRTYLTGLAIGLGILTKLFPVLLLPAAWRFKTVRRAMTITGVAIVVVLLVYGTLYLVSPNVVRASVLTQPTRGSWETVWALIDGNMQTGLGDKVPDRFNLQINRAPMEKPPIIPPILTLPVFIAIGLWFFWKSRKVKDDRSLVAFVGITWMVHLFWNPGWSPQWVLYLIPLILLSFSWEKGMRWALLMVLLTIFEWPLVLGRHAWAGLWVIVPLRMLLFAVLLVGWYQQIQHPEPCGVDRTIIVTSLRE